jgi:hypothetical protein
VFGSYAFFALTRPLRAGDLLPPFGGRLNDTRMPSMAEDVTTDLITMLLRVAGSRR